MFPPVRLNAAVDPDMPRPSNPESLFRLGPLGKHLALQTLRFKKKICYCPHSSAHGLSSVLLYAISSKQAEFFSFFKSLDHLLWSTFPVPVEYLSPKEWTETFEHILTNSPLRQTPL
jgi:hypothetical protein